MTTVTVLDDYQGIVAKLDAARILDGVCAELNVLTAHIDDEAELIEALRGTRCLVLIRERSSITAAVIEALPELKLIVQTGRLSGCIDLEACKRHGIEVRDGTGNPIAPAELTWSLILAASRRVVPYASLLAAGVWQRSEDRIENERLGRSLHGRTLGVWAHGKIGARVASFGKAFGMKVVVHGREGSRASAEQAGHTFIADRRAFFACADVVSLHLRLNADTRHVVTVEDLTAMPQDSLLVNTSRAELIAPGALLAALASGRPAQAALDVFEDEPAGARAYAGHPQVLATPHLGFVERDTYESYFGEAFAHVRQFLLD
ncbi:D-2-hydroxyacid dehydrogenase family protein [Azoarcus sp. L1K30]|uniref:D-2-hydroxyacid dehydrogenase family protein n=1 Tax=Azoarcus sp. L1K30 TaxID=2820277 RepID=UPI001B832940|nr:D-2-hydroxyacid dehydrogenase family protein [Azoarcus sp. L1K30]MBR0565486.1 D-2-hydroxyacid dehydrogenase family protein [Azoarcus sp. L1K30]